jgi:hypothetical protein
LASLGQQHNLLSKISRSPKALLCDSHLLVARWLAAHTSVANLNSTKFDVSRIYMTGITAKALCSIDNFLGGQGVRNIYLFLFALEVLRQICLAG